jgi:hypothetical protein
VLLRVLVVVVSCTSFSRASFGVDDKCLVGERA